MRTVVMLLVACALSAAEGGSGPTKVNPAIASGPSGPVATATQEPSGDERVGTAWRVVVPAKTANPWDVQLILPIQGEFPAKTGLEASFWIRCPGGIGTYSAYIQQGAPPWGKIVLTTGIAVDGWRKVTIQAGSEAAVHSGALQFGLSLGQEAQELLIGGLAVVPMKGR